MAGLSVRVRTLERGTALALCGEEVQHARLPHVHTAPRALKVPLGLQKATAIATGHSCSVQGRGTTRRPWAPCGRLVHVRKRAATALALCGEEAQHARLPCSRAAPHLMNSSSDSRRSPHKRRVLFRSVEDSGVTRRSWPRARPGCLRVCAHTSAPLRSLSVGRRRSTRACGARAPCRMGLNWPSGSRRQPR